MQRQAMGGEVLSEQAEASARIDDHQAAAVNCHRLHGEVIQGRRLARAGGAEHQQMGVLLAVGAIERIEEEGLAATVPQPEAGMACAARAAIEG